MNKSNAKTQPNKNLGTEGTPPAKTYQRLDTEALLVTELVPGMHYECLLANGRRVQYIDGKTIKWYSAEIDEYKVAEVHDYQLKNLNK